MKGVTRVEQSYDLELANAGKVRCYTVEHVERDGRFVPVYRERVIDQSQYTFDRTPWWKRTKKKTRKKS